jgi:hypothetical protein
MRQPASVPPVGQRHGQGRQRQGGVQGGGKRPADHAPAIAIQHDGQEKPAFGGRNISEVGHPDFVGPGRRGGPLGQAVGGNRLVVAALSGLRSEAAARAHAQALVLHQPAHAALAASVAAGLQFMGQPDASVRPPARDKSGHQGFGQTGILLLARAGAAAGGSSANRRRTGVAPVFGISMPINAGSTAPRTVSAARSDGPDAGATGTTVIKLRAVPGMSSRINLLRRRLPEGAEPCLADWPGQPRFQACGLRALAAANRLAKGASWPVASGRTCNSVTMLAQSAWCCAHWRW